MKIYAAQQPSDEEIYNQFLGKGYWIKVFDTESSYFWYLKPLSRIGNDLVYNLVPDYFIDEISIENKYCMEILSGTEQDIHKSDLAQFRIIWPLETITEDELQDFLHMYD